MTDPHLYEKLDALAFRLENDPSAGGAGAMIRDVLNGQRDDREYLMRARFQAFVKSMREIEEALRAMGVQGIAGDLSQRIDEAVLTMPRVGR